MLFDVPEDAPLAGIVAALSARDPRPPLTAESPALPDLPADASPVAIAKLTGEPSVDAGGARALAAALLLWNDDLRRATAALGAVEGPLPAAIRAAIHRRGGDAATSREWAKLAGSPSFGEDLRTAAKTILWERPDALAKRLHLALRSREGWSTEAFGKWVASCVAGEEGWEALREPLERIQELELALLAHAAYRAAVGAHEGV